ncbi:MAG TPA: hypothetical protein VGD67_13630 [Pseudonocardiaceae bacterium]
MIDAAVRSLRFRSFERPPPQATCPVNAVNDNLPLTYAFSP